MGKLNEDLARAELREMFRRGEGSGWGIRPGSLRAFLAAGWIEKTRIVSSNALGSSERKREQQYRVTARGRAALTIDPAGGAS